MIRSSALYYFINVIHPLLLLLCCSSMCTERDAEVRVRVCTAVLCEVVHFRADVDLLSSPSTPRLRITDMRYSQAEHATV